MQDPDEEASEAPAQASRAALAQMQPAAQGMLAKVDWQDVPTELADLAAAAAAAALLHMSRSTRGSAPMQNYNQHRQRNWASGAHSGPLYSNSNVAQFLVSSILEQQQGPQRPKLASKLSSLASGPSGVASEPPASGHVGSMGLPGSAAGAAGGSRSGVEQRHEWSENSSVGASNGTSQERRSSSNRELNSGLQHDSVESGHGHGNGSGVPMGSSNNQFGLPDAAEPLALAARPSRPSTQVLKSDVIDASRSVTKEIVKGLWRLNKQDLQGRCRERGMPTHGNRHDLIQRIINHTKSL